jgi:hypothetical protein
VNPRRKWITWTTAIGGTVVAIVAAVLVITAGPTRATQFATLHPVRGTVEVRVAEDGEFAPGTEGQTLPEGATVRTGPDGRAEIEYFDSSLTRLDGETEYTLVELSTDPDRPNSNVIRGKLGKGRTLNRVVALTESEGRFETETPTAVAAVRGTDYLAWIRRDGTEDVWVISGELGIETGEQSLAPTEGQGVTVNTDGTLSEPFELTEEQLDDPFLRFRDDLLLAPDGLGVGTFGQSREEVVEALTELLGEPDNVVEDPQGIGSTLAIYMWSNLEVVFGNLGDAEGFREYSFGRPRDPATGRLTPWKPAPWEEALTTPEGIGIGTGREEAEAAYPVTYSVSFLRDLCLEAVRHDGLTGLAPGEFLLYLSSERNGLYLEPLIDDAAWAIGATLESPPALFCQP